MEGNKLITIKNHNNGFKAMICDNQNVLGDTVKDPHMIEIAEGGDCQQVKYLLVNSVWYLVFCQMQTTKIYDHFGEKLLFTLENQADSQNNDSKKFSWFTCAQTAFNASNSEEFIAVGTSDGRIHAIGVKEPKTSFVKGLAYAFDKKQAIMSMAYDPQSKELGVGTGTGLVQLFLCDKQTDWRIVKTIQPAQETPVISL